MKFLDNNVIRVGGGVTVFRIRRFIQMMALIVCVASVTLLLYQNAYGMRVIEVSFAAKESIDRNHPPHSKKVYSNSPFQFFVFCFFANAVVSGVDE